MKFLPLIWRNLLRRKTRTALTLLSILVAFILYGFLGAIRTALTAGIEMAGADRLIVRHKVSIIQLLPASYQQRMERIPGVRQAVHQTWFGGIYQDPKNFFASLPVQPEPFLAVYPEIILPAEQRDAWLRTRTGAIVGRATAERFGWKVGDRIALTSPIWSRDDAGAAWEFDLVGIYDGAKKTTDTTGFYFRFDYFDEARAYGEGQVGWYTVQVDNPDQAAAIAGAIDAEFENSPYETKAEPEGAFMQGWAQQLGDIGQITTAILGAVFFTILLIAGNTMGQSVRERTEEIGVLKALGFSDGRVLGVVLTEALLLSGLGGLLGLGIAAALIAQGSPVPGMLPVFYLPGRDLALGVALVFALGLATGVVPAWQAMRLRTAEALRRLT